MKGIRLLFLSDKYIRAYQPTKQAYIDRTLKYVSITKIYEIIYLKFTNLFPSAQIFRFTCKPILYIYFIIVYRYRPSEQLSIKTIYEITYLKLINLFPSAEISRITCRPILYISFVIVHWYRFSEGLNFRTDST
jgi:hypothetical protein